MGLAGHQATVQAGILVVGAQTGNSNGVGSITGTGTFNFDTGVLNVASLQLGNNTGGTSQVGATSTFTLGTNALSTGSMNVAAFSLLNLTNAQSGTKSSSAWTINGGSANINANITMTNTTTNSATATITLAGGVLNMMGHNIAAAPANTTFTFVMPSTGQTAKIMNLGGAGIAGAGLNMNGTGMLLVDGPSNTYTGGTTISSGVLNAFTNLPAGGTVNLNGGTLAGNASVGNVVMNSGVIAPGNGTDGSVGTLTMDSLTVNSGNFRMDLSPTAGASDRITVNGAATFNGSSTITPIFQGAPQPGSYTVLTAAS